MPSGSGGYLEISRHLESWFEDDIPGFKIIRAMALVVSVLLSLMMLGSGIGLLNMQTWARTLTIIYASISILNHLFCLIFDFIKLPITD